MRSERSPKTKGKSWNPFKAMMAAFGAMLKPTALAVPRRVQPITAWVHSETRVAKAAAKRMRKSQRNTALWYGGGYAATRKWLGE